jgi:hypothetical protein
VRETYKVKSNEFSTVLITTAGALVQSTQNGMCKISKETDKSTKSRDKPRKEKKWRTFLARFTSLESGELFCDVTKSGADYY